MNRTAVVGVTAIAVVAGVLGGWVVAARAAARTHDSAAIVAEWGARIVQIGCNFLNSDATGTTLAGSGMLVRGASGELGVVASADVLSRDGKIADACHIDFTGGPFYTALSGDIHVDPQPMIDAGFIHLSGVGARQAALAEKTPLCPGEPIIGDPIVVGKPDGICGSRRHRRRHRRQQLRFHHRADRRWRLRRTSYRSRSANRSVVLFRTRTLRVRTAMPRPLREERPSRPASDCRQEFRSAAAPPQRSAAGPRQ